MFSSMSAIDLQRQSGEMIVNHAASEKIVPSLTAKIISKQFSNIEKLFSVVP